MLRAVRAAAAVTVLTRLARGRDRSTPLVARPIPSGRPTASVVIPARNEAQRIGPCLEALAAERGLLEVIVVDDQSTDGTADVAERAGARLVRGRQPPPGWVGKPWALQQGLEAARGDVIVCLDADTRPRPGLAGALLEALDRADFVTAGARFVCETPAERALHPSMLATLVYRFGPADARHRPGPSRTIANGQCTAAHRERLLGFGGYRAAAGHMTDDAALARALARARWRVAFRDGGDLLDVRMYESAHETWREWGRSLALPDVTPPLAQAADLAVVWATLAAPPLRALAGRADRLDALLIAVRLALLPALRRSYARRGLPFWLSPLLDPAVAVRLTLSALRPARRWRGRTYPSAARTARR